MTAHSFRLFVADDTLNSALAIANLTALCEAWLPNRYGIEVVDVLREPDRALLDDVAMTPTLLRIVPTPRVRILGTLTDTKAVMAALGLGPGAA